MYIIYMVTSEWIGLQTGKVEEAVVLVPINPVQRGDVFFIFKFSDVCNKKSGYL